MAIDNNNQKPKILFFVEDEPDIVELYNIAFEAENFTVESVFNGKDALTKLEQYSKGELSRPAMIILDLLLPDISGMEVLKEIRKNPFFDDIPVLVLTNYSSDKIQREISKTPNTQYLLKIEANPTQCASIIKKTLETK